MSDAKAFIRVRVQASLRVYYDQTLVFTREEWEEFKGDRERDQIDSMQSRLNLRDVFDAGDLERFTAHVVDAEGDVIKPRDEVEAEF